MVCPCIAMPLLATTGAAGGGVLAMRRNKTRWLTWVLLTIAFVLTIIYIMTLRRRKQKEKNQKPKKCSVCRTA